VESTRALTLTRAASLSNLHRPQGAVTFFSPLKISYKYFTRSFSIWQNSRSWCRIYFQSVEFLCWLL